MLDQRALLEARRALLCSNLPVAEIGFPNGYPDPALFQPLRSRNTGMPPRIYRGKLASQPSTRP